jgi:hypothetical protein
MFVSVKARVLTDASNVYTEIPALLTPTGILEPLIDYFLHRSHDRSLEWMRKVARSIRLFLEYLQVNPTERDPHRLFQNFAQRLYTGISANNLIHAFLQFVLLRHFSHIDKDDKAVVMPAFRNPVLRMSKSGLPKRDESVHSPLP